MKVLIKITQPIIVEGKYDKIKLDGIFDTQIIYVDGFRIYKNEKMQATNLSGLNRIFCNLCL